MAGRLSSCSSCYLLNCSMSFSRAAGQAWFSPNARILKIKHRSVEVQRVHIQWGCSTIFHGDAQLSQSIFLQTVDIKFSRLEPRNEFSILSPRSLSLTFGWSCSTTARLPIVTAAELVPCPRFDVHFCVLDSCEQLSDLRSPISLFSVYEGDRMDSNSFVSFPVISGNKGWCWRKESAMCV